MIPPQKNIYIDIDIYLQRNHLNPFELELTFEFKPMRWTLIWSLTWSLSSACNAIMMHNCIIIAYAIVCKLAEIMWLVRRACREWNLISNFLFSPSRFSSNQCEHHQSTLCLALPDIKLRDWISSSPSSNLIELQQQTHRRLRTHHIRVSLTLPERLSARGSGGRGRRSRVSASVSCCCNHFDDLFIKQELVLTNTMNQLIIEIQEKCYKNQ